jgi:hypothetical protein
MTNKTTDQIIFFYIFKSVSEVRQILDLNVRGISRIQTGINVFVYVSLIYCPALLFELHVPKISLAAIIWSCVMKAVTVLPNVMSQVSPSSGQNMKAARCCELLLTIYQLDGFYNPEDYSTEPIDAKFPY